jgi:exodeoxyribonuclease-3
MDRFYESGWVDTLREFDQSPGLYTWWSQRFPSVRLQNKGWRIDYINVTEPLRKKLVGAAIYPDVKHSDHCPVFLELAD